MARAQIARDIVLARSVRPYLSRGVVLLTGNGHVRKDIGVPYWLSVDELRDIISIGLLEAGPAESDGPRRRVRGALMRWSRPHRRIALTRARRCASACHQARNASQVETQDEAAATTGRRGTGASRIGRLTSAAASASSASAYHIHR